MDSFFNKALVYVGAATWFVTLTLMGINVPEGFWRPLAIVSLVIAVLLFAYDRLLWRLIPEKWSDMPDLRGTWRGTVHSNWSGEGASTNIEAYFVVHQTASAISVLMMTKESRSSTITAKLEKRDGTIQVVGVYRNEPSAAVRDRSPIHYGSLRLHVGGPPSTTLEGTYWTDRSTQGDLHLEFCKRDEAGDFASAQALCV